MIARGYCAFSQSIVLAFGWRRRIIAFTAGALSTLALAPFGAWPILFVTLPVLVWLLDGSGGKRGTVVGSAASIGWWFGFGYFFSGLYWIGIAFLVDAQTFGWLMPFAVVALPAGLSLFTAIGCALARLLWTRGPVRIFSLAASLTVAEWVRGHVLGGFPWNAFGYALSGSLALAQTAALVGLWGLTFLTVLICASPAALSDDRSEWPRSWFLPLSCVVLLISLAGYGGIRLNTTQTASVADVRLRIMQPNLPQDLKFNYDARQQIMTRYMTLSERSGTPGSAGLQGITHLIWPESAFPFFLTREAGALAQIADLLPPGTLLITGAARLAQAQGGQSLRAYNSIYVIEHDGSITSAYDKVHLVPFGEFLPFQDALERLGLMQLTKVKGGFLAGERRRPLQAGNAPPFAPLICYEAIFPGEVVIRSERAGWMLNLTNDAWFGNSIGPYQHFAQARLRAIEEGLPLVRVANTGISAVVDPLGRIIIEMPLGAEGAFDSSLPQSLPPTFAARWGDAITSMFIFLSFVAAIRIRRRYA